MSDPALKLLIVDDDDAMREVLTLRLTEMGHEVTAAANGQEGERLAVDTDPDLVISDVVLPDLSGIELLSALKAGNEHRPVLMITAYGAVDTAVEAIKLGAMDFLTKPLDYKKLAAILREAGRQIARRGQARMLETQLSEEGRFGLFVGRSTAMRGVYQAIGALAASDASAIITGESGTGKELAAHTLHNLSGRSKGPFIAVNTAAIPETLTESELFGHVKGAFTGAVASRPGYFEQAHLGTLFLDEIAEMPAALQAKLLRVLEDGRLRRVGGGKEIETDTRVIAATNRGLDEAVRDGHLRQDLFYRLSVFTIELPPLRDRSEDIELLAHHFVRSFSRKHSADVEGVSEAALACLTAYRWPGNVRELRNALERAVIVAREGWIEEIHLPPFVRQAQVATSEVTIPVGTTVAEAEKRLILETLRKMDGNKSKAARALGLDVRTIRYKIRDYEEQE